MICCVYDRHLDTVLLIFPFLSPPRDLSHRLLTLQGLTSPHSQRRPFGLMLAECSPRGQGRSTSALQETSGIGSRILNGMGSNRVVGCSSKLIPSSEVPFSYKECGSEPKRDKTSRLVMLHLQAEQGETKKWIREQGEGSIAVQPNICPHENPFWGPSSLEK